MPLRSFEPMTADQMGSLSTKLPSVAAGKLSKHEAQSQPQAQSSKKRRKVASKPKVKPEPKVQQLLAPKPKPEPKVQQLLAPKTKPEPKVQQLLAPKPKPESKVQRLLAPMPPVKPTSKHASPKQTMSPSRPKRKLSGRQPEPKRFKVTPQPARRPLTDECLFNMSLPNYHSNVTYTLKCLLEDDDPAHKLILVTGQHGAGKSYVVAQACREAKVQVKPVSSGVDDFEDALFQSIIATSRDRQVALVDGLESYSTLELKKLTSFLKDQYEGKRVKGKMIKSNFRSNITIAVCKDQYSKAIPWTLRKLKSRKLQVKSLSQRDMVQLASRCLKEQGRAINCGKSIFGSYDGDAASMLMQVDVQGPTVGLDRSPVKDSYGDSIYDSVRAALTGTKCRRSLKPLNKRKAKSVYSSALPAPVKFGSKAALEAEEDSGDEEAQELRRALGQVGARFEALTEEDKETKVDIDQIHQFRANNLQYRKYAHAWDLGQARQVPVIWNSYLNFGPEPLDKDEEKEYTTKKRLKSILHAVDMADAFSEMDYLGGMQNMPGHLNARGLEAFRMRTWIAHGAARQRTEGNIEVRDQAAPVDRNRKALSACNVRSDSDLQAMRWFASMFKIKQERAMRGEEQLQEWEQLIFNLEHFRYVQVYENGRKKLKFEWLPGFRPPEPEAEISGNRRRRKPKAKKGYARRKEENGTDSSVAASILMHNFGLLPSKGHVQTHVKAATASKNKKKRKLKIRFT